MNVAFSEQGEAKVVREGGRVHRVCIGLHRGRPKHEGRPKLSVSPSVSQSPRLMPRPLGGKTGSKLQRDRKSAEDASLRAEATQVSTCWLCKSGGGTDQQTASPFFSSCIIRIVVCTITNNYC